jgi:selenocysteine-specific elongation factor
MHVIGTAGHVDHGKSTLVHALTGIDPDRLREEKEREMTIDLGFAWLTLPDGESVGIVDVPGHRDFIENMLAGVGGIDAVLFIIAADEGVMPQTTEHLAILDLLGVSHAVVALTKSDLAESEEWISLVSADVEGLLAGTNLAGSSIVPVSAKTGQGLPELISAVHGMLAEVDPHKDGGQPRLPVDRTFVISGFGTVVTGTLGGGTFSVGQEVEIQPRGLTARVRGLQTHQRKIQHARPGSRVAINLSGVSKDDLRRGDVVASPGWLRPTVLVDTRLQYLRGLERPLRHNTRLKFFSGAADSIARVRLLSHRELPPGETGWAQLELEEPVALVKGDRFIVRNPSPAATVGGGTVVDPYPGRKHRRFRPEVIKRLETMAQGSPSEILHQALDRTGPSSRRKLLAETGLAEDALVILEQLVDDGQVVTLGKRIGREAPSVAESLVATHSWWSSSVGRLSAVLEAYHAEFPLRIGMPRQALRGSLKMEVKVFNAFVARAADEELAVEDGAVVRLPTHTAHFSGELERKVEQLLAQFRGQPYSTPSAKECTAQIGIDALGLLIGRGDLVQVSDDVLFLPTIYEDMVARIREHLQREGSITLADARDLFATSRKYMQALLEHLDAKGVTKRVGDQRVLRGT